MPAARAHQYAARLESAIDAPGVARFSVRALTCRTGRAFARGSRPEIRFDKECFPGGGMCLHASILERFLSRQATMNSHIQLGVPSRQREKRVRDWPPRAGVRTRL